jgi:cytochrome c biogenesis protein CcmG/thiol:disulfide interchange protein DsbE
MNWKRAFVGIGVGAPVVALLAWGLTQDPREVPSTMPGQAAPPFSLRTLDGADTVRLAELAGEVVVLNFWASWCIPCRAEHGQLTAVANAYRDRGVRFLGLVWDDRPAAARAFLDELGEVYPSLMDDGTKTAIDYGVYGVPETFVIDHVGKVRFKKVGPILDAYELSAVLEPILAERAGAATPGAGGG